MTLLSGDLSVQLEQDGDDLLVSVAGDMDAYTAPRVRGVVLGALAGRLEPLLVTVDMSELTFIDSTGLGVLIGVLKRLRYLGGDLVLQNPSRQVVRVLGLCGLDRIFSVEQC